ncbi:hypothetical protein FA369_01800, partial [Pseudomonas aeruginosa]|nr:hypothetical protein [Pseudomonas aeruginosa]
RDLHSTSRRQRQMCIRDRRDAELKKSADGMGIRFTVLADDPAPRFKLPRSEALPVTYIVDARGEMRQRLLGEQTADGILKQLEALREGR